MGVADILTGRNMQPTLDCAVEEQAYGASTWPAEPEELPATVAGCTPETDSNACSLRRQAGVVVVGTLGEIVTGLWTAVCPLAYRSHGHASPSRLRFLPGSLFSVPLPSIIADCSSLVADFLLSRITADKYARALSLRYCIHPTSVHWTKVNCDRPTQFLHLASP